ncbi:hypothetical protein BN946_scf185008.g67 [Trametes cinnabarina]|uniref:Uncharacterized protein n=1 Tax=Pycnoporus cinnabarinus TaxID=5643 RepID=A0A060SG33_PYCCI|nr:hypothetical protein BN946_scf185008.g67 [Trametes cinnabarina]
MRFWSPSLEEEQAVLRAVHEVTTDWVLLLDEDGLAGLSAAVLDRLLLKEEPELAAPMGPRGVDYHLDGITCISSSGSSAAFLVPPMVLPTTTVQSLPSLYAHTWSALGGYVSLSGLNVSGGLVLGGLSVPLMDWCPRYTPVGSGGIPVPVHDSQSLGETLQRHSTADQTGDAAGILIFMPSSHDLRYVYPIACAFRAKGHSVSILTHGHVEGLHDAPCQLSLLSFLSSAYADAGGLFSPALFAAQISDEVDVIFSIMSEDFAPKSSAVIDAFPLATIIHIPTEDLPYTDWMTALDLAGWKNWHTPEIQLSVITNDRPDSLRRLLSSLNNARYFGDHLNLRINVEQTADPETLRMVDDFRWTHGSMFLHHRVVHGGLLTSVVESWYPHGNDSYALILEDDVELSPLFYAYLKLSLLQYRYGKSEDRSPNLFGISLYQQKNLELRPEGRHLFNARSLFEDAGIPHPNTPYLSQIPCSWGALYFPEHWREFHAYLIARMSEDVWPLRETVVPDVRSNRWTRSWKKYFIELVYLRGYVMLYPNYPDYASLSTNHLEVGSHVKDVPAEVYLRKKKLFNLPLMPLPPAEDAFQSPPTGLLELPNGSLPSWKDLPILDLLGDIVAKETVWKRGSERRAELTGCDEPPVQAHDVPDLLCVQ